MSRSKQGVISSGLPQVNLLPPEIRAARGLKVVKRWLGASLVLVVILLGGAFAFSLLTLGQAQVELIAAQDETARLQAEEKKYAEVPAVLTALEQTQIAREMGMSTEIQWQPYFDALTAVLPPGVSLDSINLTGATPMQAPPAPTSPLQEPSVGMLQFTGRTTTVPDTSALIDALNSVPGFSDAWVTTAQIGDDEGTVYYEVASTVQLTEIAYSKRFVTTEEES